MFQTVVVTVLGSFAAGAIFALFVLRPSHNTGPWRYGNTQDPADRTSRPPALPPGHHCQPLPHTTVLYQALPYGTYQTPALPPPNVVVTRADVKDTLPARALPAPRQTDVPAGYVLAYNPETDRYVLVPAPGTGH